MLFRASLHQSQVEAEGEPSHVIAAAEQLIDQAGALVRRGIGEKRAGFLRSRNNPSQREMSAAEKIRIGGERCLAGGMSGFEQGINACMERLVGASCGNAGDADD